MEDMKLASELSVGDPVLLDQKIAAIRLAGPQKLQVSACISLRLIFCSLDHDFVCDNPIGSL